MRRISLRHKLHKTAASYAGIIEEILHGAAPRIEEFAGGIRIADVLNDIKRLKLSDEQAKIVLSYFNKMSNGFMEPQIALIEEFFPNLSNFVREEFTNASSAGVANNALSHAGDVLPTRIAPSEISLEVYQKYLEEAANYKKLIEAMQKSPEQFRQRYLALTPEQKKYPMQLWEQFKPANMPETIEGFLEGGSKVSGGIIDVEEVARDALRRSGIDFPQITSNEPRLIGLQQQARLLGVNSPEIIPPLNGAQRDFEPIILEAQTDLGNTVARNSDSIISRLRTLGTADNLKLAGKIMAGIASGLAGLALYNYIFGGKDDKDNENVGTPPNEQKIPESDSSRNELGYEQASLIMKAKGYINSIETDWTNAFDAAFRSFIDDGTRIESETKGNAIKTNLSGGQQWKDIAISIGFEPNKKGAFAAIKIYDKYVVKKDASSKPGQSPSGSGLDKGNQDVSSDKFDILANIIGAMYNQKLVGTPGFDLIREPKRIQALVNAVGGPNPTGYANAAKEVVKRNQNILYKLPQSITGPIDKDFAKDKSNKSLLQDIQVVINDIYDSAMSGSKTLGVFNPRLEKSTELIANFLRSASAGNFMEKNAINSLEHWVKLAEIRKLKIREEIRQEMSPSEMASARRQKMREAI